MLICRDWRPLHTLKVINHIYTGAIVVDLTGGKCSIQDKHNSNSTVA